MTDDWFAAFEADIARRDARVSPEADDLQVDLLKQALLSEAKEKDVACIKIVDA